MEAIKEEMAIEEMAIKAHNDIIRMGTSLLNDPSLTAETKDLIRQEMENSHLCMDAFGLEHE